MTESVYRIRTDETNPFAHHTLKVRVPATIREVMALNPDYPESVLRALGTLADEIASDALMPPLDPLAPDYEVWAAAYEAHRGQTWLHTDWYFSELYFYRLLIQHTRWWETGRDPFAPQKQAEVAAPHLWALLVEALDLRDSPPDERLRALLHFALWGNRMDLSFAAAMAHGAAGSEADLLVNDDLAVIHHLLGSQGPLHIIADNTGTELAMDLALADAWLDHPANTVVIHLKLHPTYVSDAIVPDAWRLVHAAHNGEFSHAAIPLGKNLAQAADEGRLRFAPDGFWNGPLYLEQMPERLRQVFSRAVLVIVKGDMNYRRMLADCLWPADKPFAECIAYFPAPILSLRTLKSDLIVGLPPGKAHELDAVDQKWRVNGRRGIIQWRG